MPKKTKSAIEIAESNFNTKYGVEFSVEGFEEKISFFDNMGSAELMNKTYRDTFTELYKKTFANFVDGKIGNKLDVAEVIRDFENIMEPLREQRSKNQQKSPTVYGGWTTKTFLAAMNNVVENVPNDKLEYAANRYRANEFRVRDVRAYANALRNRNTTPKIEELATLYCYGEALSKVSKEPARGWRIKHFFKCRAAKREAGKIKDYLVRVTGGALTANSTNEKFNEILRNVNDSLISDSKKRIETAYKAEEAKEINKVNNLNQRESVKFDASIDTRPRSKTVGKINESKEISKQRFENKFK